MTAQPSEASRRPWRLRDQPAGRRRVLRAGLAYAALLLLLVLFELSPSPVVLAAFFVAGLSVTALFADRLADSTGDAWVTPTPAATGLGRGADHRTVAVARRLAAARDGRRDPAPSRHLAAELQQQLTVVLADQVRRERGWDIVAEPALAYEALPSDLADLVAGPPDLRLVDPRHLSAVLDRLETP